MEPFALALDALSVAVLIFVLVAASKALHAFKQSRQTVTESASLVGSIVSALTSRLEVSESVVNDLRAEFDTIEERTHEVEDDQKDLRSSYVRLLQRLEEILINDRKLILELEQVKLKLSSSPEGDISGTLTTPLGRTGPHISEEDILGRLTDTERQTIEILAREGPKRAPDLGRRLRKSREHTSRLMKKLYLEGYIDRESSRAPYRYKLNERVLAALTSSSDKSLTAKVPETA